MGVKCVCVCVGAWGCSLMLLFSEHVCGCQCKGHQQCVSVTCEGSVLHDVQSHKHLTKHLVKSTKTDPI